MGSLRREPLAHAPTVERDIFSDVTAVDRTMHHEIRPNLRELESNGGGDRISRSKYRLQKIPGRVPSSDPGLYSALADFSLKASVCLTSNGVFGVLSNNLSSCGFMVV